MTKKTKVRTLVAMLIAIVLGGGYLIADKQEVKKPGQRKSGRLRRLPLKAAFRQRVPPSSATSAGARGPLGETAANRRPPIGRTARG
jgi:hypothetical protein